MSLLQLEISQSMATVSYGTSLPADEVRGHPALAIYMWVGCGIATVVVAVRLYTRLFWKQAAGWDDLFIALSYVRTELDHQLISALTESARSYLH